MTTEHEITAALSVRECAEEGRVELVLTAPNGQITTISMDPQTAVNAAVKLGESSERVMQHIAWREMPHLVEKGARVQ